MLDETYRKRAIENHLRSVPIFASLLGDESQFQEFVDYLRPAWSCFGSTPAM